MSKPYTTYAVVETKSFKFGVHIERQTVVPVSDKAYRLLGEKKYSPYHTYNRYWTDQIQEILDNEKLRKQDRELLQDCKMLLEEEVIDTIKFIKRETYKKWKEENKEGVE